MFDNTANFTNFFHIVHVQFHDMR